MSMKKESKLSNIDLNKAWANAQAVVDRIKDSSPDDLKPAYKQFEVRVGTDKDGKCIASIMWKSWKLQICTFEPTSTADVTPLSVKVLDQVFIDSNDQIIVRMSRETNLEEHTDLRKAMVYELLDAFLDGQWTPPWKCGYCRDRIKGIVKPRW